MRVGSLFSGVGLLDYGLHLAGFEHEWLCEVDPLRRSILAKRFPGAWIYDDVRSVGGEAERVDLIAGGFPCKGASTAGKREGLDHPETALWREMHRAVRELRPRFVLIENVANILALHGGAVWGTVLGDLAESGYDAEWDCLPAAAFGAPHVRDRVFCIATDADAQRESRLSERAGAEHAEPRVGGSAPADAHTPCGEGLRGSKRVREEVTRADGNDNLAATDSAQARRRAPSGTRQQRGLERDLGAGGHSRGVAIEWGGYGAAVERWEQVNGPAPEPLVRRVDDRSAARVERSRLSALGDGVLVQAGEFVGRLIMERH